MFFSVMILRVLKETNNILVTVLLNYELAECPERYL
jgi:hypothetical protein